MHFASNWRHGLGPLAKAVLAVLVLVLLGSALYFGPRFRLAFELHELHRLASKKPVLAARPLPLPQTAVAETQGARLSYFGYEFETPWADLEASGTWKSFARAVFRSGQIVTLNVLPKQLSMIETVDRWVAARGVTRVAVFGADSPRSNYAIYQAAMNLTPDEISIFTPPQRAAADVMLLEVAKSAYALPGDTGIYSFSSKYLRGFQFGDPDRVRWIRVIAFDPEDREVVFVFGTKPGAGVRLSQAEINRVVQTLRPTGFAAP
jgi:hypothetical protein